VLVRSRSAHLTPDAAQPEIDCARDGITSGCSAKKVMADRLIAGIRSRDFDHRTHRGIHVCSSAAASAHFDTFGQRLTSG
jgi:hypothetical protein